MVQVIDDNYPVIFRTNLTVYDFTPKRVVIQHEDGTRCEFIDAVVEEDSITKKNGYTFDIIKVYTEHNGDHWFAKEDLAYYKVEQNAFPTNFRQRIGKVYEYWKSIKGLY